MNISGLVVDIRYLEYPVEWRARGFQEASVGECLDHWNQMQGFQVSIFTLSLCNPHNGYDQRVTVPSQLPLPRADERLVLPVWNVELKSTTMLPCSCQQVYCVPHKIHFKGKKNFHCILKNWSNGIPGEPYGRGNVGQTPNFFMRYLNNLTFPFCKKLSFWCSSRAACILIGIIINVKVKVFETNLNQENNLKIEGKVEVTLLLIWVQHDNVSSYLILQRHNFMNGRCPFLLTVSAKQSMGTTYPLATGVLIMITNVQGGISYTSLAELTWMENWWGPDFLESTLPSIVSCFGTLLWE